MKIKRLWSCLLASLCTFGAVAQTYEVATWDSFKKSAITFTFDDCLSNQYSTAVPLLDKYGFKGSFYLVTNWMGSGHYSYNDAKKMAANGHEIGSHTVSHANLNTGNYISEMSNSKSAIEQNVGNKVTTIVYPNCVAPSSENECAKYYIGGRICNGQVEGPTPQNYFEIGSLICGNQGYYNSLSDFQKACNSAKDKKGWAVFLIHEIDNGSGYSPLSSSVFEQTLSFLKQNSNDYWVTTFENAIKYSKERNDAKIKEVSRTSSAIKLEISTSLDTKTYNYPITIKTEVPSGWASATITQGNNKSEAEIRDGYLYFSAIPGAGDVTIAPAKTEVLPEASIISPKGEMELEAGTKQIVTWTMTGAESNDNELVWMTAGTGTILATEAEASSEWCTEDKSFCWKAENILNEGTDRWAVGSSTYAGEWVSLTLANTSTVGGVIIDECTTTDGTVTAFEIQYDNGDSKWQTAYTGTTIGENKTISFAPVKAKKIRLYIKSADNVNINYFAPLAMGNTTLHKGIGTTGEFEWEIPSSFAGTSGKLALTTAMGTLIAESDIISFIGDKNDNEDPITNPTTGGDFFDENGAYYGPSCEDNGGTNYSGAYYTGVYHNLFADYLGKTEAETKAKLDAMWKHYMTANGAGQLYYDKGNEAYILDSGNNDVRSEGMSYGMMICVQTDHQEEFDKLWSFAKNHMLHTSGQWAGYFSWQVNPDGSPIDQNCAPDGEMYFTTALLFASHRWGNNGKHNYEKDAQFCLKNFVKGNNGSLFNESQHIVTFQPYNCSDFSDPSYDLPGFVELFARWSDSNKDFWRQAVSATRNHLKKSSHSQSGLFSDYNNFDGTPKSVEYNSNSHRYMYDAMRCATNVGMDYNWFGADAKNQEDMMERLINHFEKNGYKNARFNWDGSNPSETYTLGEAGANAVGCFALTGNSNNDSKIKTNLKKAWEGNLMTGQWRYYDGLVHYLAMLNLTGNFKIWKPAPEVEEKDMQITSNDGLTFGGKTFTEAGTAYAFDDCTVYKLNLTKNLTIAEQIEGETDIMIAPNPASDIINIVSAMPIERAIVYDLSGKVMVTTNEKSINVSQLNSGNYIVRIITTEGVSTIKVIIK